VYLLTSAVVLEVHYPKPAITWTLVCEFPLKLDAETGSTLGIIKEGARLPNQLQHTRGGKNRNI
jgi:hypothetical protein